MIYLQRQKRLLKRVIVGIILLLATVLLWTLLNFIFVGFRDSMNWWHQSGKVVVLTTFLATLLYKPCDYLIHLFFRHILFKKKLDRLAALQSASKGLIHTLDLRELSNMVVNTLSDLIDQRSVMLVLHDKVKGRYWIASSSGLSINARKKISFVESQRLIQILREQRGVVEREKCLLEFSWPDVSEVSRGFESLGASALLSISCDGQWMGFLALSGKRGGEAFSSEETKAVENFAHETGFALRNALAVDEMKQTNERLKDLHSRLLQTTKLAAIEQLAEGIAHEIHNPLTIISGKAQILLLRKDGELDRKSVEDALKTIVKQTERAADITRKLLMFSEPKSSGRDIINFESVVDDTLALISYQTTLDEISIRKHISKDIPPFRGEINEIREVFLNLILNAVQAIEKRGTVQLRIRHLTREGLIEIKIEDNGKGITAESIPKLFNPFFTTRDGGLGLGLFITQQIVHRYHGSIHVESELGRGTVVLIHLPEQRCPSTGQEISSDPAEIHMGG